MCGRGRAILISLAPACVYSLALCCFPGIDVYDIPEGHCKAADGKSTKKNYTILTLKVGGGGSMFIYFVPKQYVRAIKVTIMGYR